MKIKLLKDCEIDGIEHKAGEVLEPVFEIANQLVKTGYAVLVEGDPKPSKKGKK